MSRRWRRMPRARGSPVDTGRSPQKKRLRATRENALVWNFAEQQAKLLQTDAHGDRRDKEGLGKRPGDAVKRFIVSLGRVDVADPTFDARDFDVGVADRRPRLEDALLAIREHRVPG